MRKDRLKTRKPHSKLFEIQLIECISLIILFILSYYIAAELIYRNFFPFYILDKHIRLAMICMLIVIIFSFYKFFSFLSQPYTDVVRKIIVSGFLLNAIIIALLYFVTKVKLSAYFFIDSYIIQIMLVILLKMVTNLIRGKMEQNCVNLVITEDYFSIRELLVALRKECKGRLAIVSYDDKKLSQYVSRADNIYLTGSVTEDLRNKVISCCTLEDKKVYIIPGIYEIAVRQSAIHYIGDTPLFSIESFQLTEVQKFVKRLMDIVLSLLGIILSLPIFLFAAVGIKREDKGPVFYKQERSGLHGKPFKVIKFRSMVEDAEKDTGAIMAKENDHRITKIGCIMRSVRIDEIPQFFNVLTGSMSLVGPRPERPVFVEEYSKMYPEYQYRLSVKPGITGLAQVKGNYTTTPENKMKFDLMYIINYSLLLDFKILAQTVRVVLKMDQAKGYGEYDGINCFYDGESATVDSDKRPAEENGST